MTRADEVKTALTRELTRLHVYDWDIVGGGKHKKLTFSFKGKDYAVPFSTSPSDVNAAEHAVHDLRKRLGVTTKRKTPAKAKRVRKPKVLKLVAAIAEGPEPLDTWTMALRNLAEEQLARDVKRIGDAVDDGIMDELRAAKTREAAPNPFARAFDWLGKLLKRAA